MDLFSAISKYIFSQTPTISFIDVLGKHFIKHEEMNDVRRGLMATEVSKIELQANVKRNAQVLDNLSSQVAENETNLNQFSLMLRNKVGFEELNVVKKLIEKCPTMQHVIDIQTRLADFVNVIELQDFSKSVDQKIDKIIATIGTVATAQEV